ncbi:hypothetical protein THAOC_14955, partial [Thalassiosira oceanica]
DKDGEHEEERPSKGGCNYNDDDDKEEAEEEEEEEDDDDFIVDDDDDNKDGEEEGVIKMTTRFMTKRRSQDQAIYASPRDQNDQNDLTHLSRFTICFVHLSSCLAHFVPIVSPGFFNEYKSTYATRALLHAER